jgi:hypothetical protein
MQQAAAFSSHCDKNFNSNKIRTKKLQKIQNFMVFIFVMLCIRIEAGAA